MVTIEDITGQGIEELKRIEQSKKMLKEVFGLRVWGGRCLNVSNIPLPFFRSCFGTTKVQVFPCTGGVMVYDSAYLEKAKEFAEECERKPGMKAKIQIDYSGFRR